MNKISSATSGLGSCFHHLKRKWVQVGKGSYHCPPMLSGLGPGLRQGLKNSPGAGQRKGRVDAAGGVASRQPAGPTPAEVLLGPPLLHQAGSGSPSLGPDLSSANRLRSEGDLNRRPCFESREMFLGGRNRLLPVPPTFPPSPPFLGSPCGR